ncbi:MAG: translation initiation factor IF-3 [bacterium]
MRKSFRGYQQPTGIKEFRVNEKIFAPEVMIIDENGENLGVMKKEQALAEARERGFDLIEVSPKAVPPICKFMDYGSYKYQKEKAERKQKSKTKTIETKTVKISFRISQHDLEFRANQAAGFLVDGDKVRIELQLRGRENQHEDLARDNIKAMLKMITEKLKENKKEVRIEQPVKKMGGRLSMAIAI